MLEKRFKILSSQVLVKLNIIRYIINNIHAHRSSTAYIITIIAAAKDCDQEETEYTQILHI
jgi:hypothetical protein